MLTTVHCNIATPNRLQQSLEMDKIEQRCTDTDMARRKRNSVGNLSDVELLEAEVNLLDQHD